LRAGSPDWKPTKLAGAGYGVRGDLGVDQWPSWNPDIKSVELQGPVQPGTVFRWKAGPSSLTSTLQVVDPPREIAWTGTTIGKGYSRRTLDKGIRSVLAHLKAERRAATA
jgi:hypothetical protein